MDIPTISEECDMPLNYKKKSKHKHLYQPNVFTQFQATDHDSTLQEETETNDGVTTKSHKKKKKRKISEHELGWIADETCDSQLRNEFKESKKMKETFERETQEIIEETPEDQLGVKSRKNKKHRCSEHEVEETVGETYKDFDQVPKRKKRKKTDGHEVEHIVEESLPDHENTLEELRDDSLMISGHESMIWDSNSARSFNSHVYSDDVSVFTETKKKRDKPQGVTFQADDNVIIPDADVSLDAVSCGPHARNDVLTEVVEKAKKKKKHKAIENALEVTDSVINLDVASGGSHAGSEDIPTEVVEKAKKKKKKHKTRDNVLEVTDSAINLDAASGGSHAGSEAIPTEVVEKVKKKKKKHKTRDNALEVADGAINLDAASDGSHAGSEDIPTEVVEKVKKKKKKHKTRDNDLEVTDSAINLDVASGGSHAGGSVDIPTEVVDKIKKKKKKHKTRDNALEVTDSVINLDAASGGLHARNEVVTTEVVEKAKKRKKAEFKEAVVTDDATILATDTMSLNSSFNLGEHASAEEVLKEISSQKKSRKDKPHKHISQVNDVDDTPLAYSDLCTGPESVPSEITGKKKKKKDKSQEPASSQFSDAVLIPNDDGISPDFTPDMESNLCAENEDVPVEIIKKKKKNKFHQLTSEVASIVMTSYEDDNSELMDNACGTSVGNEKASEKITEKTKQKKKNKTKLLEPIDGNRIPGHNSIPSNSLCDTSSNGQDRNDDILMEKFPQSKKKKKSKNENHDCEEFAHPEIAFPSDSAEVDPLNHVNKKKRKKKKYDESENISCSEGNIDSNLGVPGGHEKNTTNFDLESAENEQQGKQRTEGHKKEKKKNTREGSDELLANKQLNVPLTNATPIISDISRVNESLQHAESPGETCTIEGIGSNSVTVMNTKKHKSQKRDKGNENEKQDNDCDIVGSKDTDSDKVIFEMSSNVDNTVDQLDDVEVPVEFEIPPLHQNESLKQIAKEQVAEFHSQGIKVRQGRWTKQERDILLNNWNDFSTRFKISDPALLLGINMQRRDKQNVQAFIKAKHFYVRLAKGLSDRTLCGVYRQARTLLNPRKSAPKLTVDEVAKLKKYQSMYGNKWTQIANVLEKKADQCSVSYRAHKDAQNSGPWTEAEKENLKNAVHAVVGEKVKGLSYRYNSASWKEIAKLVHTRNAFQCRQHWLDSMGWVEDKSKRLKWGKESRALLIYVLYKTMVDDETLVNWNSIFPTFKRYVASYNSLKRKWRKMRSKVPGYKNKSHKEIVTYLFTNTLPKLMQKLCISIDTLMRIASGDGGGRDDAISDSSD